MHPVTPTIQHMGINHRGFHILVPEQLLHGSNVVSVLQQMGRKRMTERVARRRLGNAGPAGRVPDRFLNNRFVQVVSMSETRSGIEVMGGSGKHPLPGPLAVGIRVLPNQGVRQRRPAQPLFQIGFVLFANSPQVVLERLAQHVRQHGDPIFLTFAVPDGDFMPAEVQILDPQLQAFEQPQPRTV